MRLDEYITITGDIDSGEIRLSARPRTGVKTGYLILPPIVSRFIWRTLQAALDVTVNVVENKLTEEPNESPR